MKLLRMLVILFALIMPLYSCTENDMAKNFGGEVTIKLDKGMKLVEVTWKDDDLWFLLEPMEEGYVPQTKYFIEESSFGIMEGKVIFVESR